MHLPNFVRIRLLPLPLSIALVAFSEAATITNGSFENLSSTYVNTPGTDSMSAVAADGWTVSSESPDWFLGAPGPAGLWFTPWGDFFAVGAATGSSYREGFSQTITGLSIGESYTITFEQANGLLYDQATYLGVGNTGGWELFIDGGSIGTPASTNDNSVSAPSFPGAWNSGSVTFEATATSQTLEFLAYGGTAGNPTFQFLDSVALNSSQIPEPAASLLTMIGGLTLLGRRRR